MSNIVMYDNTKTVTITIAMPRASIPNYLIAANPCSEKETVRQSWKTTTSRCKSVFCKERYHHNSEYFAHVSRK